MVNAPGNTPPQQISVTAIGTGTCVPRLDRGGACTLLRQLGAAVVVDLGLGALHGLLRAGVSHREVGAVLFTHLHPDHTAELASLLFAARHDERPRVRELLLAGGPGLAEYVSGLLRLHGGWLDACGYSLQVRELAVGEVLTLGSFTCRTGAVAHTDSSLAFRFEAADRSLVISGDTGPSPTLEQLAHAADLLLLEASLAEGEEYPAHLTAAQAGALGRRAGVKRLVLTHLYPAADAADPEGCAAAAFGRPVTVAGDGLEIVL